MKRKVTKPRRAASKSTVNEVQRQLLGTALRMSVAAQELVAMGDRLVALSGSLQRSQGR